MPLAAKRKQFVSSQRGVARQVVEVRKPARETASRTSGTRKKLKSLLECVVRKRLEDSIASNYEKDITWHSVPQTSLPEFQWIVHKSRIPNNHVLRHVIHYADHFSLTTGSDEETTLAPHPHLFSSCMISMSFIMLIISH